MDSVLLASCTIISFSLFAIISGKINLIRIIMCIEIMLSALLLILVVNSVIKEDVYGYAFAVFIVALSTIESVIGLTLLVNYYSHNKEVPTSEDNIFDHDQD